MVEIHHIYVAVFAGTALLSLAVAWVTWSQREAFRASAVMALMLGVAVWCAAEAVLWWVPTFAEQRLWLALTYPGSSIVVVAFAVFALDIAEVRSWLTPKRIVAISAVNAALCLMAMTNPGGLVATSYFAQSIGPYTHYIARPGPLFWVYVGGSHAILAASFVLVFLAYVRSAGAKRAQVKLVLVGSLIPFVVSLTNQFGPHPLEGLEAASFCFTGIFYFVAIARGVLVGDGGRLVTVRDVAEAKHGQEMLDAANDFLARELQASQLAARTLYDQATRDPLTGLYNRRAMNEYLTRETLRSARTGEPLALLMADIDQLKQINDALSHSAGDAALVSVGENLLVGARTMDIVCRLGGDEFLIIMSGVDASTAFQRAEELRQRISKLTVGLGDREMSISVSIGIAAAPTHGTSAVDIIAAADRALHAAKAAGRDRTEVAVG